VTRSDQSSSTRTRLLGSWGSTVVPSVWATERPPRRPNPATAATMPARARNRRPHEANQVRSMKELSFGCKPSSVRASADQGDRPDDELTRLGRAAGDGVGFQHEARLDGNVFAGCRALEIHIDNRHADELDDGEHGIVAIAADL